MRYWAMGIAAWARRRRFRPDDIPAKLTPEALQDALTEARFLHAHSVDVQELQPAELPGPPKPADD